MGWVANIKKFKNFSAFGELIDPKERWYALTQGAVSDYITQNHWSCN
jgi:hypothetical protein